jgi:hypothetical protein
MSEPGFHSLADIPDHLREAVDRHISDMFPGEMHNDVSFLLCFLIFNYCVIVNCILNCVFFVYSYVVSLKKCGRLSSLPQ